MCRCDVMSDLHHLGDETANLAFLKGQLREKEAFMQSVEAIDPSYVIQNPFCYYCSDIW